MSCVSTVREPFTMKFTIGFAPGVDFTQVFKLLDVQRNGRIQRKTFIQVSIGSQQGSNGIFPGNTPKPESRKLMRSMLFSLWVMP